MRDVVNYFRANPQVLVLVLICLILGFGTFLAVVISLASAGHGTPSGETSGWLVDHARLMLASRLQEILHG